MWHEPDIITWRRHLTCKRLTKRPFSSNIGLARLLLGEVFACDVVC